MNFHNVNSFSTRANTLSGNCFPMTPDQHSSIPLKMYSHLTLTIELTFLFSMITKIITSSSFESAQNNIITMLVSIEFVIVSTYMNTQRKKFRLLISKINIILKNSSDHLEKFILNNFSSTMKTFKVHYFVSIVSLFVWTFQPLLEIGVRDVFTTEDYQVDMDFIILLNGEFGAGPFVLGALYQAAAQAFLFSKKSGLNLYLIHFVRILTAEYQYIQHSLSQIIRDSEEHELDEKLNQILEQHNLIVQISKEFPQLFSINITMTYINSTIKLSTLAYKAVNGSKNFVELFLVTLYSLGIVTETYLMCDSIDLLKEMSTSIFDKAFHEPWYIHSLSSKKKFLFIIFTSTMECRLTTCKPLDLTLPALKTILSNAYSAGLLLMRVQ